MSKFFYFIQVLATLLLTSTALAHKPAYQTAAKPFCSRQKLSLIQSIITEYSSFILFAKLFFIYEVSGTNFFNGFYISILYKIDMIIMLSLWGLFLQSVFARHPIYDATKFMRNESSSRPPSIFTWSFWLRFSNPFWTSRSVLLHDGIGYGSGDEVRELSEQVPGAKELLSLDIFQHPSFPRNCPVVIYIHGGQFRSGSKAERPPIISYLALKRYVVVSINYRLGLKLVDQLVDVKRSIRWVKENISKFGGDPEFICLMGSCAGGLLATMASMTINNPKYQPGFENVDTTVKGVISINGFYDLTRPWGYKFNHSISDLADVDTARQLSPTWVLKEVEANKLRISATEEDKLGIKLPPILVIHGGNDCIAPIRHVFEFKKEFQLATRDSSITFIELYGAGHEFYKWSSVRSHTIPYGIEPFVRSLYEDYSRGKSIE